MKLTLNPNEKHSLVALRPSTGYAALLDVMHKLITVAEDEHMATRPDDAAMDVWKLAFKHARVVGMRDFLNEVMSEVDAQVTAELAPKQLQVDEEEANIREVTQIF